jgi:hypothetical protein
LAIQDEIKLLLTQRAEEEGGFLRRRDDPGPALQTTSDSGLTPAGSELQVSPRAVQDMGLVASCCIRQERIEKETSLLGRLLAGMAADQDEQEAG